VLNKKDYLFVGIQMFLLVAYVFSVDVMSIALYSWFRFTGVGIATLDRIKEASCHSSFSEISH